MESSSGWSFTQWLQKAMRGAAVLVVNRTCGTRVPIVEKVSQSNSLKRMPLTNITKPTSSQPTTLLAVGREEALLSCARSFKEGPSGIPRLQSDARSVGETSMNEEDYVRGKTENRSFTHYHSAGHTRIYGPNHTHRSLMRERAAPTPWKESSFFAKLFLLLEAFFIARPRLTVPNDENDD